MQKPRRCSRRVWYIPMSDELKQQKAALRRKFLDQRAAMPFDVRTAADAAITARLLDSAAFQNAEQVFCYVSMPHEVSTRALLAAILRSGKTLGLPVCTPSENTMTFYRLGKLDELQAGAYRIPVPPTGTDRILTPDSKTLMIVPMLAFDAEGFRLGAGGGYYDRYLATNNVKTIGICYAEGRITSLPHSEYDKQLDCCITEQKTEDFLYG